MDESLDIGKCINTSIPIDNFTKCALLGKHWVPPPGYIYPFSIHIRKGKEIKRNVLPVHLQNNQWLVLSDYMKGLFCKYCTLFAANTSKNANTSNSSKEAI